MIRISNIIIEREMMYEGVTVLTYKINYPEIIEQSNKIGIFNFNIYNKKQSLDLQKEIENELYKQAVELYKYNKKNGYPQRKYEIVQNYEISYNANNVISLYVDEYVYSGGAHGETIRKAQNWNILTGKMIKLEELYRNNPYFLLDVLKEINRLIAVNPRIYFENSCELVINAFNPENFYIGKDAIYIFYQQYDIAPYSTGIPTFRIRKNTL